MKKAREHLPQLVLHSIGLMPLLSEIRSVGEIRDEVSGILSLPENAQVRLNGAPASEQALVPAGAAVEFVKLAGEKGVSARS